MSDGLLIRSLGAALSERLIRIEHKLDILIGGEAAILTMETMEMTTTAEIKAQSDALIAKVTAETDAVAAVTTLVNGLKASVADLTQQLKDAIANGADPTALQQIADNLTAATNAVDANTAAESALANTDAQA